MKLLNIKYYCYAYYAQVYMTLKPCDKRAVISFSIEACIEDITIWMNIM